MILRKDIQIVAYLFQKRIDFHPLVTTVYVDDSLLSEEMRFKLGEYETEPEKVKIGRTKRTAPKKKKEKVIKPPKQPKQRLPKPVKKPTKIEIMLRHKPKVDIAKIIKAAQESSQLPKDYQRPKAEYSNTQWQDYYKD
jgi:outer membrane biosynthesis protein TonB